MVRWENHKVEVAGPVSAWRYGILICALAVLVFGLLALTGCGDDEEAAKQQAQQQQPMPVKAAKATEAEVPYTGEYVGQIAAKEVVEVRARVEGYLLERTFEEGQQVEAGQLLFVIDPKQYQEDERQAQAEVARIQAQLEQAKRDYERFDKLYKQEVISREEYETKLTNQREIQARLDQAKAALENAKLNLGYTEIHAPIAGRISRTNVDIGSLVGKAEPTLLATITSIDPVYVNFSVSEREYLSYARQRGNPTHDKAMQFRIRLADNKLYDEPGAFNMMDPQVDKQTGTLGVRVVFPNPDGVLRPGQFAKVVVTMADSEKAMLIPQRAVLDIQGRTSVLLVGANNVLEDRQVTLGRQLNGLVVVEDGLKPGEVVVTERVRQLKPGIPVTPQIEPITLPQGVDPVGSGPAQQGTPTAPAAPEGSSVAPGAECPPATPAPAAPETPEQTAPAAPAPATPSAG